MEFSKSNAKRGDIRPAENPHLGFAGYFCQQLSNPVQRHDSTSLALIPNALSFGIRLL